MAISLNSKKGKLKFTSLITVVLYDFPLTFLLDWALYVIMFSVLDTGVIYLWPWV